MDQIELTKDISGLEQPTSEPTSNNKGKNYLLGIGIDNYQKFVPLKNAVKDLNDITTLLVEKYQFENSDVSLLVNEQATRKNVIQELKNLCTKAEENDRILIYYSGHGYLDEVTERGFWIPIDAEKEDESTFVSNSDLQDYIKSIKGRHVLLISDSCFSGTLLARDATRQVSGAFDTWEAKKSRYVFTSGKGIVSDGKENENSPFAKAIIEQLENPAESKINIVRLADEVTRHVRFNYEQQPEVNPFYATGHEGGQFIFHHKGNKGALENLVPNSLVKGYKKVTKMSESLTPNMSTTASFASTFLFYMKYVPFLVLLPIAIYFFRGYGDDVIPEDEMSGKELAMNTNEAPALPVVEANENTSPPIKNTSTTTKPPIVETNPTTTNTPPITTGTVKDINGNSYSWNLMNDGKKWMTKNLKTNVPGSWCLDDKAINCKDFGRHYNWAAARNVCPKGWHLPSKQEWDELIKRSGSDEYKAFDKLSQTGSNKFSAQFGNASLKNRKPFDYLGRAYYWSSNREAGQICYVLFRDKHIRHELALDPEIAMSCRCVAD